MDSFLREGVNIQSLAENTLAGDAHFFEEVASPAVIKQNLASNKVLTRTIFVVTRTVDDDNNVWFYCYRTQKNCLV